MKKTLLLVVLIGFIAIFSDVNTQACPDDPEDPWTSGGFVELQLSPDCVMLVEYCWRTWAEGSSMETHDVWLGDVIFIGDCLQYRIAFDANPTEYLRRAWEDILLLEDPWDVFDPNNPPTLCPDVYTESWRAGSSSCYGSEWEIVWVPDNPSDPGSMLGHFEWRKTPCSQEFESGCWRIIELCFLYENNMFIPVFTESNLTMGNPNCSAGCTFICY